MSNGEEIWEDRPRTKLSYHQKNNIMQKAYLPYSHYIEFLIYMKFIFVHAGKEGSHLFFSNGIHLF